MALDYRKCAEEIYSHLGGKENIASAAHCATRLRLAIVDIDKVDVKALENVEGVQGVFSSNGQLQCIIGTGTVNHVYDEFLAVTGLTAATKQDVKDAAAKNMPLPQRMVKTLGDVFVPILPAIVASGLMMGIVEALGKAVPGFASTDWYGFMDMVSNTAFAYLPVIVAVSAARVFGGNIFLGAVIGLLMIHSALLNGWNVGSKDAINAFFGVKNGVIPTWNLFGNSKVGNYVVGSIRRTGYQGHVIPVIISVWFMSKIEKKLHDVVPAVIDLFVTPLCTVFVTALLTFVVIGPIFSTLETYVLEAAKVLITSLWGLGAAIMGAVYPVTVVMGLHHMYNVIEAGMLASKEFNNTNIWMPLASAANFAQFGACLAVAIKTKNPKTRTVALPSALSASLGITEPAIFGVNLRFMKPFVAGMIGGAIGAWFGSITKLGASAYGVTGIPGYLTINNPLVYTIELAIAAGIAFAITMVIWKDNPEDLPDAAVEEMEAPKEVAFETDKGKVIAPVNGKIVPASAIPDPMFAAETMGPSVGIEPTQGRVYAPFNGSVTMVFPTQHAIGVTSDGGIELLIHVGVDTVNMEGKGFECTVKQGDKIEQGQVLLDFDRSEIKAAGYSDTVAVIITNKDALKEIKKAAE
jgi:PTS system sucrose-specific IIC component